MEVKQILDKITTTEKFPLNYDCVYYVFQWLDLNDCISFVEAFEGLQCVADWTYKRKFTKLTFDFVQPIDRILYQVGPFLTSLTLIMKTPRFTENDLIKIRDTCKQLRSLHITGFDRKAVEMNLLCVVPNHLETLTLDRCSIARDESFFQTTKNLKCLNMIHCRHMTNIAMNVAFENNQGIESFVCVSRYLSYTQLLQRLPNLERTMIDYSRHVELNSLSNLKSLRHFTLFAYGRNVNEILIDLAKINILEELVLNYVAVDGNTFEILKSFQKLKLLVVTTKNCDFPSSDALPSNLRALKLGGFRIVRHNILSLVRRLKYLEDIYLRDCEMDSKGNHGSITDFLYQELRHTNRKLNITVTIFRDQSVQVIYNQTLLPPKLCPIANVG